MTTHSRRLLVGLALVTLPALSSPAFYFVHPSRLAPQVQPKITVVQPIVVPTSAFVPVTKSELIKILQLSIEKAKLDQLMIPESAPFFKGRQSAFEAALELAELLP